jgi:integrase
MEAEAAAALVRADAPPEPAAELTLSALRDKWLALKKADERISEATRADYKSHLDLSILPEFGAARFSDVDIAALRIWIRAKRKTLAPSTVRNRFSTLSTLWDDARAEAWTTSSNLAREPGVRAELPELPRYQAKTIPLEDFGRLVLCPDVPAVRRVRYLLAALAGLCDGEIAGLRVANMQLAQVGKLTVRQAVATRGKSGWASENDLKNKYRERQIPVHPVLAEGLSWWLTEGFEQHVCREPKAEDWLVPRDDGKAWRPRSADLLREDLATAGVQDVPAGFKFHSLRACFASWLEEAGVAQASRDRMLGHRGKSTAAVHYTSAVIAADRAAVASIPLVATNLVPSLVPRHKDQSHLRDLNPRPTVYEILDPCASGRPEPLRSAQESPVSGSCNGADASNGQASGAALVPQWGASQAELLDLQRALRGLVVPWEALEQALDRLSQIDT